MNNSKKLHSVEAECIILFKIINLRVDGFGKNAWLLEKQL